MVNIDGVRDKLRVLLVSGKPHPGERMWRNLLKSDANVDLVHFTILRPPEKGGDGVPINELSLIAFPVADLFGRKIKDFDLIIFDRYAQQSILPYAYLENIADYVRNGGALLMAEGPEYSTPDGLFYSPLGAIAPAEPSGEDLEAPFRAQTPELGLRHPVTRGLVGADEGDKPPTWGRWFRLVGAKATDGQTVMTGPDDRPLLVLSRVDKGRVGLLLSDQMWLWARGYDGGGPYLDLLRRLAHWLMKEPELEEEALRASARGHVVTVERQSVSGEARDTFLVRAGRREDQARADARRAGPHPGAGDRRPVRALPRRGRRSTSRWSTSARRTRSRCATSSRPRRSCGRSPRRREARRAGSPPPKADDADVPRIVSLNPAPSYSGSDFIGIKRTGASELIGARSTSLASGFFGLALLLGAVVAGWLSEAGRFDRRAEGPVNATDGGLAASAQRGLGKASFAWGGPVP